MNTRTIIVLGCARSGTSMTAGVLDHLGVNIIHDNVMNEQNIKGSYETAPFNALTSKMQIQRTEGVSEVKLETLHRDEIVGLMSAQSGLWGWKSAATHWNLSIFLKHAVNPHLVVVVRNLLDNANSWIVHMKEVYGCEVTLEEATANMALSTKTLVDEVNAAQCPKIWTTYESIKSNVVVESSKFATFLGLEFSDETRDRITNFVLPSHTTLEKIR